MRIDGQSGGEDVRKLFLKRDNRAVVVAAFENDGAKLAAACVIVSDHLRERMAADEGLVVVGAAGEGSQAAAFERLLACVSHRGRRKR